MVVACCLCKKKALPGNGTFFNVPKDEKRRLKWAEICQKTLYASSRICVDHFHASQLITAGRKLLLMPNAEPIVSQQSPENYVDKIRELERENKELNFRLKMQVHNSNMALNGVNKIFTEGQIRKLEGCKKIVWKSPDISSAICLHAAQNTPPVMSLLSHSRPPLLFMTFI